MTQALAHTPSPLGTFALPETLSGQYGQNRAPHTTLKHIHADNDLSAIQSWLSEFELSPQTYRHVVSLFSLPASLIDQRPSSHSKLAKSYYERAAQAGHERASTALLRFSEQSEQKAIHPK